MTRRALCKRLAVCLVLGAVTTVAVAWGFAWVGPIREMPLEYAGHYQTGQGLSKTPFISQERAGIGGRSLFFIWDFEFTSMSYPLTETQSFEEFKRHWGLSPASLRWRATNGQMKTTTEFAVGWPMPALWCSWDSGNRAPLLATTPLTPGVVIFRQKWYEPRAKALPLLPIWRGLLVNTLLFATMFALLLFSFPLIRAKLRSKRGECPMCGYDQRGTLDAGCPECGWGKGE